jgi:type I restriction enzyme S subunit
VIDFTIRLRTAATHLNFTYMERVAVLEPNITRRIPTVETRNAIPFGAEHYTDLKNHYEKIFDSNRFIAEAYRLTPDDFAYILSSFPVFARKRPEYHAYILERIREWKGERRVKRRPTPKAPNQFKQAVILAWIVHRLYSEGYPVSRYRAGKMLYLIERILQLGLFRHYLKQAAGPYDPDIRYREPEHIAVQQQQWLKAVDDSHFEPGPNMDAALQYANQYLDVDRASELLEQFRKYKDATLNRWTTVDMVARDLGGKGAVVTAQAVVSSLHDSPEWHHKPDQPEFSLPNIESTLSGLKQWGLLSDDGGTP